MLILLCLFTAANSETKHLGNRTANKENKNKRQRAFHPNGALGIYLNGTIHFFDVHSGDLQSQKVISLVCLLIFLSCGVYNLCLRAHYSRDMIHLFAMLRTSPDKRPIK